MNFVKTIDRDFNGLLKGETVLKRLAIFSFYDKDGIVDEYIDYLLNDLQPCISRLVIAVNGKISDLGVRKLKRYTDEIIIRENKGFDAGAYRDVMVNHVSSKDLLEYDELILCNDTFYGPFIPFTKIFSDMESENCDFWGMNYCFYGVANYLQSYFLVFRKSVIRSGYLINYFRDFVDENTEEIEDVYAQFERGLFSYLADHKQMTWASFVKDSTYDVYKSCNFCIRNCGLPVIKKKAFCKRYYHKNNSLDALKFINTYTDYDIKNILDSVKRQYQLELDVDEITSAKIDDKMLNEYHIPISQKRPADIESFINSYAKIYLYGAGIWARIIYWLYLRGNKSFTGFIISDGETYKAGHVFSYPVLPYSTVKEEIDAGIIVGMGDEISRCVREKIGTGDSILYLW